MNIRVGLIGPRRSRTGTGPFVARFLRDCGCEVFEWTRAEASSLHAVDAVAICSPPQTHFDYIRAALGAGMHVFCEKPFVWPHDPSGGALRKLIADLELAAAAARGGLVVHENTQWPYTLGEYRRMTGEFDPKGIREFSSVFAPSSGTPAEMIMETASHANSLLLAIGCSGMEDVTVEFCAAAGDKQAVMDIRFTSRSAANAPVDVHYRFEQCEQQPRTAAYAVNGRWVERRIGSPGYQILFCHQGSEMRIEDPVERSVHDFVEKVAAGTGGLPPAIRENLEMSAAILERAAGL